MEKTYTFGQALDIIIAEPTKSMRLPQWKEDVKICVQYPTDLSKMSHPYLFVESRFGKVPWKETFVEMFSKEWMII